MAGENGTNIAFKLNGNVILGRTSTTYTSNSDEIELSSADDGRDSVYTIGRDHDEISGEFNMITTGTNDLNNLFTAKDAGTSTPFIWGGLDSGDFVIWLSQNLITVHPLFCSSI